jgi:hypothetical protein
MSTELNLRFPKARSSSVWVRKNWANCRSPTPSPARISTTSAGTSKPTLPIRSATQMTTKPSASPASCLPGERPASTPFSPTALPNASSTLSKTPKATPACSRSPPSIPASSRCRGNCSTTPRRAAASSSWKRRASASAVAWPARPADAPPSSPPRKTPSTSSSSSAGRRTPASSIRARTRSRCSMPLTCTRPAASPGNSSARPRSTP